MIIHFVEDGFTAFGSVWYRGQELKLSDDQVEANSWAEYSESDQEAAYGKVFFKEGEWPGKKLSDDPSVDPKAAAEYEKKEAARAKAAPKTSG